jgi:deferrochelatase/peroxidase EfeB
MATKHSTRRGFLSAAALTGLGAGIGVGGDKLLDSDPAANRNSRGGDTVAFFGAHQAGIATPTSEYFQFAAFDVVSESRDDLRSLLAQWSAAAALLTVGQTIGAFDTASGAPVDTGESLGSSPAALTVTFGFGPTLFSRGAQSRFGLAPSRPAPLAQLPPFAGEALDPRISNGDIAIQVCADDPQVAFHAVHNLIRMASPVAEPRWLLAGFGKTSNSRRQVTPRNLMGFKDGTDNIMVEDKQALDRFVWAASESPPWMRGGSYMVVRRIKMLLGAWDATALTDQQRTFGRRKISGAPLTGARETDTPDLNALSGGLPVIPTNAHVRLASPSYNGGQRILRRGYSFVDGIDYTTGSSAGGLMFICFQRDPRAQFIPIQRRLAGNDALNRHIQHIGSAIFACPPGAARAGFVGDALFA